MSTDDSDDDIWEYKSLIRHKKAVLQSYNDLRPKTVSRGGKNKFKPDHMVVKLFKKTQNASRITSEQNSNVPKSVKVEVNGTSSEYMCGLTDTDTTDIIDTTSTGHVFCAKVPDVNPQLTCPDITNANSISISISDDTCNSVIKTPPVSATDSIVIPNEQDIEELWTDPFPEEFFDASSNNDMSCNTISEADQGSCRSLMLRDEELRGAGSKTESETERVSNMSSDLRSITQVPLQPKSTNCIRKQTSLLKYFTVTSQSNKGSHESICHLTALVHSVTEPSLLPEKTCLKPESHPTHSFSGRVNDDDGRRGATKNKTNKRACPFYKWISGTNITVDAFSYGVIPGCRAYFLTHFHYDHYQGLLRSFSQPVYCSQVLFFALLHLCIRVDKQIWQFGLGHNRITGNLVKSRIKVADSYINCLPMSTPMIVDGVKVTLLDANHCPGSVMLLFQLPNGDAILHTGDFRAHPRMETYPQLFGLTIKQLYLDTTYCDPQYTFPSQDDSLSLVVAKVLETLQVDPNTLIVCGTYTIGKERVFSAIAETLDCKIAVTSDKKAILDCVDDAQLTGRLTTDVHSTMLHVLTMKSLNHKSLCDYLKRFHGKYSRLLAFEPTGWTYGRGGRGSASSFKAKVDRDGVVIYGVPYSEHSSYDELRRFVRFLRPRQILPTVNNGSKASRDRMEREFTRWLSEKVD